MQNVNNVDIFKNILYLLKKCFEVSFPVRFVNISCDVEIVNNSRVSLAGYGLLALPAILPQYPLYHQFSLRSYQRYCFFKPRGLHLSKQRGLASFLKVFYLFQKLKMYATLLVSLAVLGTSLAAPNVEKVITYDKQVRAISGYNFK